jgi:hypothetical protein
MRLKRTIFQYKLHHLPFWILAAFIWYYLRYQDYISTRQAVTVTIIKTIDLALMIYTANYVLIPRLLYRKKYIGFALAFVAMIAASSITKMYILGYVTGEPGLASWTGHIKTKIYDNVIPHFFLVIAGVALKLMLDHSRMQKRLIEIAKEKAETELNFLKSQINPHFLFNSLNSVYFLIDRNNTEARQALHKFSDMLRYQLYEVRDEKITIEKEIGYLQDYIGLQKLRSDNCSVQLSVDEGMPGFFIEPLLLIPLVENSFKHLSHFSNGKANEVQIELSRHNGDMHFAIRNTTENMPARAASGPGGIGLANVKRRLELLYPQKHQLNISAANGWFDVHLKIKMDH